MDEPAGFRDFVAARSAALVRSAWLLTGDEASAQDLVQAALTKTWTRWSRIERRDAPEAYRFFDDLTEAQAAEVLGCSVGTVKSQNAKALAKLRACPALQGLWTESEEVGHDAG